MTLGWKAFPGTSGLAYCARFVTTTPDVWLDTTAIKSDKYLVLFSWKLFYPKKLHLLSNSYRKKLGCLVVLPWMNIFSGKARIYRTPLLG
jgi:hypothetical protein